MIMKEQQEFDNNSIFIHIECSQRNRVPPYIMSPKFNTKITIQFNYYY